MAEQASSSLTEPEEEEVLSKGDPDPTRLMARVLDKVDKTLFEHGLQFKEEESYENFAEELAALFYRYYDDLTGGDSDYDPKKPISSDSEDMAGDDEPSVSQSLGSASEDVEEDDDDEDSEDGKLQRKGSVKPAVSKRAKK